MIKEVNYHVSDKNDENSNMSVCTTAYRINFPKTSVHNVLRLKVTIVIN